eukprot:CAMPEP_0170579040 /NCGR_PEP_ID=MMETSP0224-20130122/5775_1 /TAXON_ID=285029 /ORGANISM="Togula jolla, Strain CCCM 725" /LENGTH=44 /DNA_ID= /DNA_START= /DNA_END= /DNA_ORIENTATION=
MNNAWMSASERGLPQGSDTFKAEPWQGNALPPAGHRHASLDLLP